MKKFTDEMLKVTGAEIATVLGTYIDDNAITKAECLEQIGAIRETLPSTKVFYKAVTHTMLVRNPTGEDAKSAADTELLYDLFENEYLAHVMAMGVYALKIAMKKMY